MKPGPGVKQTTLSEQLIFACDYLPVEPEMRVTCALFPLSGDLISMLNQSTCRLKPFSCPVSLLTGSYHPDHVQIVWPLSCTQVSFHSSSESIHSSLSAVYNIMVSKHTLAVFDSCWIRTVEFWCLTTIPVYSRWLIPLYTVLFHLYRTSTFKWGDQAKRLM